MAGFNPFAKKKEPELFDEPVVEDIVIQESHALTAWQRVLDIAFGQGVQQLPARPRQDRISKRRKRRLRGRAKEMNRK